MYTLVLMRPNCGMVTIPNFHIQAAAEEQGNAFMEKFYLSSYYVVLVK